MVTQINPAAALIRTAIGAVAEHGLAMERLASDQCDECEIVLLRHGKLRLTLTRWEPGRDTAVQAHGDALIGHFAYTVVRGELEEQRFRIVGGDRLEVTLSRTLRPGAIHLKSPRSMHRMYRRPDAVGDALSLALQVPYTPPHLVELEID